MSHTGSALVAVALIAIAAPTASAAPPPEACRHLIEGVPVHVQRGPTCLGAAAAMVASYAGRTTAPADVVRAVPAYVDGLSFFDVARALEARALATRVFVARAQAVAAVVLAGLPVIVAVERGRARHVLVAVGASAGPGCPDAVALVDPRDGHLRWTALDALERIASAGQVMTVGADETALTATLDRARLDPASVQAADARFRAREWVARAAAHKTPKPQLVRLLERAVDADPCWIPATRFLAEAHRRLGDEPAAARVIAAATARAAGCPATPEDPLRPLEPGAISRR